MPVFGYDLAGFRLRVEAELSGRLASRIVRGAVTMPPPEPADITVRLCAGKAGSITAGRPSATGAASPADLAGPLIEGCGFTLDVKRRTVHIRLPEPGRRGRSEERSSGAMPAPVASSRDAPVPALPAAGDKASPRPAAGPPPHPGNDWQRTAAYALGLLAELDPPDVSRSSGSIRFLLNLHASCVASPKGALVFCGHRAHGKSTIASELLGDLPLLDDDAVAIVCEVAAGGRQSAGVLVCPPSDGLRHRTADFRVASSRIAARSFPSWTGPGSKREPAPFLLPIAGLFWLKKSARFAIRRMGRAEAAAGLLSPVLPGMPPESVRNRLRLIGCLLDICPCRLLEFRKEREPLIRLLKEKDCL
ncbi:MAG: hypothetical protein N3A38_09795 [Planctomycetota bacterium]|nr:hypothetical protein [Planctomycetota bacterium]